MSDTEELAALLVQRHQTKGDTARLDAQIFSRFGQTKAVMFTDLVGFSRRVEEFGILHFLQLIQESEALFLPLIAKQNGVCLKREGDSLMVLFDHAQDALDAACALVQATQNLNLGRSAADRIEVCIGLGHGELLVIDGKEAWGAEVNAASKLGEEVAQGGDVLATESFRLALPAAPFAEYGVLFGTRPAFRWMGGTLG